MLTRPEPCRGRLTNGFELAAGVVPPQGVSLSSSSQFSKELEKFDWSKNPNEPMTIEIMVFDTEYMIQNRLYENIFLLKVINMEY